MKQLLLVIMVVAAGAGAVLFFKKTSGKPKESTGVVAQALESEKAPPAFTSFPGLSMEGLTEEQKNDLVRYLNEEICPCDCPETFAACLQSGKKCEPATLLAQWMIDTVKQGGAASPRVLFQPVTQEIAAFLSQPVTIATEGYAFKGAAQPKMTIIEFADFECQHCRLTSVELDKLSKKHSQDLRVYFKHFPLPGHPMAKQAAIAAEAASEQNRFWQMHDTLFKTQAMLSSALISGHAKAIGLDAKRFEKEINDPQSKAAKRVTASDAEAQKLNLEGTPSIFFNGRPYHLSHDVSGFELRMKMEQARAGSSCK